MLGKASLSSNPTIQSKRDVVGQVLSCCKSFPQQLIERKPMREIQTEIETKNEMRRTLNFIQLTGIGLGSIIGEIPTRDIIFE